MSAGLRGEIALARGQRDETEDALRQALSIARAIGNPTQLWKTHLALGRLHADAQSPGRARQAYEAARGVIEQVKSGLREPGLRTSLESSAVVRHIYELSAPE